MLSPHRQPPQAAIQSINIPPSASKCPSTKAQGLLSNILLAKNCKVLLISNIWKEAGLTNGANGTVKYIIYEKGKKPPELPTFLIIHFDQYTGPPFLNMEKCVPIAPVNRTWYSSKVLCQRWMLPVVPGYAMSIHKSQGASMDEAILNIGNKEFAAGLTYTAISRVRKFENVYFYPFKNYRRFKAIFQSKTFKTRIKHDEKEQNSSTKFFQN